MYEKMIKMPSNIADAWLQALRSGEYKQAEGVLYDKTTGGYCCLGVLQKVVCGDIVKKDGYEYPPQEWKEFYNITSRGNLFTIDTSDRDYALILKNDNGITFHEIANIIEQNLERLPDIPYQDMPFPIELLKENEED